MAFCHKCGKEIDETDEFCRSCGANLKDKIDSPKENTDETKNNIITISNNDNKLILIPLILGLIGVIIGIVEGLNCPMLFGWENIISEMVVAIFGGVLGLLLYKFKEEYLIAGIEFIITGVLMALLIGNMAIIGCTIFVITGMLSIALTKKFKADYKPFYTIPIITLIVPFTIIFLLTGVSVMNQHDLSNQVSIDNLNNSIQYEYGYYSGYLKGDIHFNKNINYLSMELEYLDENGKVLDKTYPLSENKVNAGQTYQFDASYMKQEKPFKARITLKNDISSEEPFYIQNITFIEENNTK